MSRNNGRRISQAQMEHAQVITPKAATPMVHVSPAAFEADFTPAGDGVLIRLLEQRMTAGGLALPDGSSDGKTPPRGQIIKVGPGVMNYRKGDGTRLPIDPEVKPGKTIYPIIHSGAHFVRLEVGDEKYIVVSAQGLIGFSAAPPESLPA